MIDRVTCCNCGKLFLSDTDRPNDHFCSESCENEYWLQFEAEHGFSAR